MDSNQVVGWVETWGPLVTLASTVVLAAITAWLAYLTKVMAVSARTAAEHSRLAADASLASVAAAEASIDVRFDVAPSMGSTAGEILTALKNLEALGLNADEEVTPAMLRKVTAWRTVDLTCRGATVTVHGLRLTYVAVQSPTDDDKDYRVIAGRSFYLVLASSDELPRVCHEGETIEFAVPDRPLDERLEELRTVVLYAIGNGPIREREAAWTSSHSRRRR